MPHAATTVPRRVLIAASAAVLVLLGAPRPPARAEENPHAALARKKPETAPDEKTEGILQKARDYKSWTMFTAYRKQPVKSNGHHGMYIVAWYNATATPGLGSGSYPEGSIIVKENRPKPDAAPAALTTMFKQAQGWYWIKSTPDGRVVVENGRPLAGDIASCTGCHSKAGGDMVFSDDAKK